ncbi:MAG: hypothetical protein HPY83_18530 [Anaerolineae bacterium]|nr:hypothetical protein [Anaerolineae bacterium]
MKVVLAVTTSEGADSIADALKEQGFRVTIMSSMGGFLRRKSATLLIGVQDEQVDQVLEIIRENAPAPESAGRSGLLGVVREQQPEVRTAALVVDMDRFEHYRP